MSLRLRRFTIASMCMGAIFLAVSATDGLVARPAGAVSSNAVVYTLSGVTFDDGGTASGSFVFDPDEPCAIPTCTAYSSVSIVTSAWNQNSPCDFPQQTYTTVTNTATPTLVVLQGPFSLSLFFDGPLGAAGSVGLDSGSEAAGAGCSRFLTAGSVVGELVDPPVTDPPVTDPPVTDPPVTDPPVTDPPTSGELTTTSEPPATTGVSNSPSSPPPGSLPATGGRDFAGPLLAIGTLAVALGAIAVVIARRRPVA